MMVMSKKKIANGIFVARLMLKIHETPMTGKVNPDAEENMFCFERCRCR
jgi:hypothetical protein